MKESDFKVTRNYEPDEQKMIEALKIVLNSSNKKEEIKVS